MHDKCAKEEGEGDSKMGSWEQCDAVMEYLRDLNLLSITLRIILSVLIGGILGIERGTKNRPAGLRTYILVCLGSALVMMTNQYVCTAYQTGDPVRLGAQVISGIGFLGAGTIVLTNIRVNKGFFGYERNGKPGMLSYTVTVSSQIHRTHAEIIEVLAHEKGVQFIEEL